MLVAIESSSLVPTVTTLLDEMHAALAGQPNDQTTRDLDLYLSVARSLLAGANRAPTAGGNAELYAQIMAAVNASSGIVRVALFGSERDEDFSQFVPRGHYTRSETLKRYFAP